MKPGPVDAVGLEPVAPDRQLRELAAEVVYGQAVSTRAPRNMSPEAPEAQSR
jgi:hypothetical protein